MKIKTQQDIKDCGLVCVQSFYHYFYGSWLKINDLKTQANYSQNGLNLIELKNLGLKNNLDIEILEGDWISFKNYWPKEPIMTLLNIDNILHYVIIKKRLDDGTFSVLDPVKGHIKITVSEMGKMYINVILSVKKTDKLPKKDLTHFNKDIGFFSSKMIIYSLFLSIMTFFLTIASSQIMKVIIDTIIPSKDKNILIVICLVFIWIIISKTLLISSNNIIQNKLQLQIQKNLNFLVSSKTMTAKLQQLNKLKHSDIMQRFSLINSVSAFKAQYYCVLIANSLSFIFSLMFLFWINIYLSIICCISLILIFIISVIYNKINTKKYQKLIKLSEQKISNTINLILNSEYNRMTSNKNFILKRHYDSITSYLNETYTFIKWKLFKNRFIDFLISLTPVILIYGGILDIYKNNLELGTVLLFTTFYNFLTTPVVSISNLIAEYSMYKRNSEKIQFLLNLKDEENFQPFSQIVNCNEIQINNLSFGYVPSVNILNIKTLKILKHNYIEAKNGFGKSTFLKLLTKYYDYNGSIKINNIELSDYNTEEIRQKIILLHNQNYLSDATVYEQITFNNISNENIFKYNFSHYNLQKLLDYMNLKLDTKIINNGQNLSDGQKSLINILKIFSFNYVMVMMDEAFENLDQNVFNEIKSILSVHLKDALTIEISHSKKYIFEENRINLDELPRN